MPLTISKTNKKFIENREEIVTERLLESTHTPFNFHYLHRNNQSTTLLPPQHINMPMSRKNQQSSDKTNQIR